VRGGARTRKRLQQFDRTLWDCDAKARARRTVKRNVKAANRLTAPAKMLAGGELQEA
jgi:hypothetical protein